MINIEGSIVDIINAAQKMIQALGLPHRLAIYSGHVNVEFGTDGREMGEAWNDIKYGLSLHGDNKNL